MSKEFTKDGREIHTLFDGMKVVGPPQWYIKQLEEMRKLPPPTIEQVKAQFTASKKCRRDNAHCPEHKEYNPDNLPDNKCYCYYCWHAYFDRHQTDEALKLFHQAMDDNDGSKVNGRLV